MAKTVYSMINPKAAAITGAVLAFFCTLFGFWLGFGGMFLYGYGMMSGYMMGYAGVAWLFMAIFYLVIAAIFGAAIGAIVAGVYNWALTLK